jgi:nitrite reductase (NADH) small subunit
VSALEEPTTVGTPVCRVADLVPERGVAAIVDGVQIAVFLVGGELFAVDHRDPASGANVLARGLVGSVEDRVYVASPLFKHRYDLRTGAALDSGTGIGVHHAVVSGGVVHVRLG